MSMNLYVRGVRKAMVVVKGKKKTIEDTTSFGLWQTPTVVTREVLALPTNDQKIEAYIRWVDSVSAPYEDNVYDYNGQLDENFDYPVIGRVMVYPAQEHASDLRAWLRMCDDEDYTVEFYEL